MYSESQLFRRYVADGFFNVFAKGKTAKYSYSQIVCGDLPDQDKRSGDEIASDVISELGLEVRKHDLS